MLKARNLTKKFGELVAVNDLSFEVEKSRIFGIAGPNGAGKSTLYNLITGYYPYKGTIEFNGKNITGLPPYRIAREGIARTFQVPQTFPSLTVEKSVLLGSRFGSKKGLDPAHVMELLEFTGLVEEKDQPTGRLNLLNKKKLMITAALATRPQILMLDEPMAGSNAVEIKSLMELIQSINTDLGVTIIIIEHFMKVLTELTHTLLIIESGTEITCGDPCKVTNDPVVIECYLGDAYAEGN
jgi:branched-chain amino acid transport system ATP-binding protein